MRARWISRHPDPPATVVGQAIVASWWPGSYHFVSTIQVTGRHDSEELPSLSSLLEKLGIPKSDSAKFLTNVYRSTRDGWCGDNPPVYERTYETREGAHKGHEEVLSEFARGDFRKKKIKRPYKWTRWAASGGGQDLAGWLAIAFGLVAAIWTFSIVPRWWLALPAAILAWVVGTSVVSGLWGIIRGLIEHVEGIH